MNKSKIDWCDYTWNPITGCRHDCPYCYARTLANRFAGDVRQNIADDRCKHLENGLYELDEAFTARNNRTLATPFGFNPTLHKYRMDIPEKHPTGANVFVGAMADIFGDWVPDEWIKDIFEVCKNSPQHNYLFLTKNPKRYWELENEGLLPVAENMWYGFSYTCNQGEGWSSKYGDKNNFVSVEPLLEDLHLFDKNVLCPAAKWVIIGAETGNRKGKVTPKPEWIEKIVAHCDKFNIPVFMKESLRDIVGDENMRQEYPPQLLHKEISEKNKKRLIAPCSKCGKKMRKSEMYSILAKKQRKESAISIGNICDDCWPSFLEGLKNGNEVDTGTGESNGNQCSCSKEENQ